MAEAEHPEKGPSLARTLGRLRADPKRRKTILRAGMAAAAATLHSVSGVVRKLWLEVTGMFFLLFAAVGVAEVVRQYRLHQQDKLAAAAVFAVVFGYFGVTSFWRARGGRR